MKTERSIFAERAPAGFPNQSVIRERLILDADTTVLALWRDDFEAFPKSVLKTVEQNRRCSEKQANVLSEECLAVAQRGTRKKVG